ncbi:MAG: ABC transporter substrate-binding protein [Balneolaceae bacterium]|nr:ABC transporter substrate-binding protein [Balneolaceae bacterium]
MKYDLKIYLYPLLLLILLGTTPVDSESMTVDRDSSEIRQLLEQRDREIKELLGPEGTDYTQQQRDKLKDIINGIIDYRAMARYALQRTWDTLSTDQRDNFVDLFSTIVRDQSMNKLDIYRADVVYKEIEVNGDSARVNTTVTIDRVRTPVIYQMVYENSPGTWMVHDMVIDDVSTAASYRRQFQNIIRKKGYQHLVDVLKKRASR